MRCKSFPIVSLIALNPLLGRHTYSSYPCNSSPSGSFPRLLIPSLECYLFRLSILAFLSVPFAGSKSISMPPQLGCNPFLAHLTSSGASHALTPIHPPFMFASDSNTRKIKPFSIYPSVKYLFIVLILTADRMRLTAPPNTAFVASMICSLDARFPALACFKISSLASSMTDETFFCSEKKM